MWRCRCKPDGEEVAKVVNTHAELVCAALGVLNIEVTTSWYKCHCSLELLGSARAVGFGDEDCAVLGRDGLACDRDFWRGAIVASAWRKGPSGTR